MSASSPVRPAAGRVLALDVGERRVGVAVSDLEGWQARPLAIIRRRSKKDDFAVIASLVAQHEARAVIVGYPLNMDGSVGSQARRVARYAAALQQSLEVGVRLFDERLSSDEAMDRLRDMSRKRQSRKHLDDLAAAVFLQEYLDQERRARSTSVADE
jgi:putative Holliday junction resolvase